MGVSEKISWRLSQAFGRMTNIAIGYCDEAILQCCLFMLQLVCFCCFKCGNDESSVGTLFRRQPSKDACRLPIANDTINIARPYNKIEIINITTLRNNGNLDDGDDYDVQKSPGA